MAPITAVVDERVMPFTLPSPEKKLHRPDAT
jgi:hypothetical protein